MSFEPYSSLFAELATVDDHDNVGSVGDDTAPADEPIELLNRHALAFSARTHELRSGGDRPGLITPAFGLLGTIGPLPYHYSEMVARSERVNQVALRDFMAIFSHRAISLLYRAWRKSRISREHMPGAAAAAQSKFSSAIAGLSGSTDLADRMAWLDLAGKKPEQAPDLFVRGVRNASGLTQFLRRQFSMPFEVEELVGTWEHVPEATLPSLGPGDIVPSLGRNTILGKRVWQVQSTFRLLILKPNKSQYELLKPGSESLRRIQLATRMYCTAELAFRIRIVVSGKELEPGTLGSSNKPAILGWNTTAGNPEPGRSYFLTICKDYNEKRMNP